MPSNLLHQPPSTPGQSSTWQKLTGSSCGLALGELLRNRQTPVLCICPDMPSAMQLEAEIGFFTKSRSADSPVLLFPDREILPYDQFSPHQDLISDRLRVLYLLPRMRGGLVIVPIQTLMHRLPPVQYVETHSLVVQTGDRLEPVTFSRHLEQNGYRRVEQVMEHGEFSLRGGLLDLFPMGAFTPYRIDLFDDEIDSIRSFGTDDQRSIRQYERIELLPAREFPLTKQALDLFYQNLAEQLDQNPHRNKLFRDLANHSQVPAGIEFYLPLFFEQTASLFDYLPEGSLVCTVGDMETPAMQFWRQVQDRFDQRGLDREAPPLPPKTLFLPVPEINARIGKLPRLRLSPDPVAKGISGLPCEPLPDLTMDRNNPNPLHKFCTFIDSFPGRVLVVAESPGRQDLVAGLLAKADYFPSETGGWEDFLNGKLEFAICHAPLERGLLLSQPPVAVIPEALLYGEQVIQKRKRAGRAASTESLIRDLQELQPGDPVVHIDYGIGRYEGLESLSLKGVQGEFLALRYADGDKILVPVGNLHLVHRYTGGDPDAAPLHKLGSRQWEKARKKAREKAHDTAAELLEINARRASATGFSHPIDEWEYQKFCAEFPFEETEDQASAIGQVLRDLRDTRPMNRIVCGDVGFGKTEVAMRAAFAVAGSGKQVAVLAPTTLLVQQHLKNFRDRFAKFPLTVESLSRFQTAKQQTVVVEKLARGEIDIIIGTHRLLQKDIRFHNLGLLVLDEEQRFGVRHKEQLKKMRAQVDLLTLTATPIPRTLSMTLAGLSDLSIIATPPARRVAVKTFVRSWDPALIREACLREFSRGGQVYFLHNKVETIERMARELEEWLPEARIAVAHGQMAERELEQVMLNFYHRRHNLLVCSTIIESGIDVPTANTILINRADRLGLAQLHQLRGRVGRSHHQAYAYLFVPSRSDLAGDALKRLNAIESLGDLGIGFVLATQDMEIRGAGEILGEQQSGEMHEVGFTLYNELLAEAIQQLQSGELDQKSSRAAEVDIDLAGSALIPDDYLPDINTRLVFYKRISAAGSAAELEDLYAELADRFGAPPDAVRNLFDMSQLRQKAARLGITAIRGADNGITVEFAETPRINVDQLMQLLQTQPQDYRLKGQQRLLITRESTSMSQRLERLHLFLDRITARSVAAA